MSNPMSRRAILKGGAVLGAAALGHILPRGWPGSGLLVPEAWGAVVLDPDNPEANFTKEGNQGFTPGNVLTLNDSSGADVINFFASDADAARGIATDVVVRFQVTRTIPNNADNGVRFAINDGQQRAVIAACITKNGQLGIGLAAGDIFADPNNYPEQAFVQVDWTSAVRELRMRRHDTGEAEIVAVDGIPPAPRKFLLDGQLASAFRPQPTVEFGCRSREAEADVEIHAFRAERFGVIPGQLTRIDLRIHDVTSNDRLRFRADFALGAGTDGIDPAIEPVRVRLSTPAGGVFYPSPTNDFNPLTGFDAKGTAPRRRWSLSPGERARTGIERFDIDENADHSGGVSLRDAMTNVPAMDYSTVHVEIAIGDDELSGTVQLVESPPGSGRWREA